MRKGELLGLRKSDIDFSAGLISIARSYGRETTKGQRAEAIPMARELVSPLAEGRGPPNPFPRPSPHHGQPAHDVRRQPRRRPAHPPPPRPAHHDRSLRPPGTRLPPSRSRPAAV